MHPLSVVNIKKPGEVFDRTCHSCLLPWAIEQKPSWAKQGFLMFSLTFVYTCSNFLWTLLDSVAFLWPMDNNSCIKSYNCRSLPEQSLGELVPRDQKKVSWHFLGNRLVVHKAQVMWEMRNDERGQDAKSLLDRKRGNIDGHKQLESPDVAPKRNRNRLEFLWGPKTFRL